MKKKTQKNLKKFINPNQSNSWKRKKFKDLGYIDLHTEKRSKSNNKKEEETKIEE